MDVRASRVLKLRKVDKVLDTPPPRRTDFFMAFDRAAFFAAVRALQSRPTPNQTVSFAVDAKVVDICYEASAANRAVAPASVPYVLFVDGSSPRRHRRASPSYSEACRH